MAGSYLREPLSAYHKLLVAQSFNDKSYFEKTVVLVMRHDRLGAYGVILNQPGIGGPVHTENTYALYAAADGEMDIIQLDDINADRKQFEKAKWSKTYKGYTGWDAGQLDKEIRRNVWAIRDFDPKILDLPPEKIWAAAK